MIDRLWIMAEVPLCPLAPLSRSGEDAVTLLMKRRPGYARTSEFAVGKRFHEIDVLGAGVGHRVSCPVV